MKLPFNRLILAFYGSFSSGFNYILGKPKLVSPVSRSNFVRIINSSLPSSNFHFELTNRVARAEKETLVIRYTRVDTTAERHSSLRW